MGADLIVVGIMMLLIIGVMVVVPQVARLPVSAEDAWATPKKYGLTLPRLMISLIDGCLCWLILV